MWAADIIVRDRVVHLWFSDDRSEDERQRCGLPPRTFRSAKGRGTHRARSVIPSF